MSKPIQVSPSPELSEKIDKCVKNRVAQSRAAFCEIAAEAFVPLLEDGTAAVVNGKIVFLKAPKVARELAAALGGQTRKAA